MLSNSVGNYFPAIYDGFTDIDELIKSEDQLFTTILTLLNQGMADQFISTASITAIAEYEKIFGIMASPATETLAFRRARLMNRLATRPPFTLEFLAARFDEIIGPGGYTITMDYPNYTLYIESVAQDASWFNEIIITVNKIKPCNIAFVSRSGFGGFINVSEVVKKLNEVRNYSLGHWFLGQKPFVSANEEVKKLASVLSIDANLLQDMAEAAATGIASVLINDTYEITSFDVKSATGGVTSIQYTVPIASGITIITNIKLRDASDNVLTNAPVYIPISIDTALAHTLTMAEGGGS